MKRYPPPPAAWVICRAAFRPCGAHIAIGIPVAEVRAAWSRMYQAAKRQSKPLRPGAVLVMPAGWTMAQLAKDWRAMSYEEFRREARDAAVCSLGLPPKWLSAPPAKDKA